jgi:nitroimidazol reductase NimA-like FMN-containing flavoprotein (pyridoxamine 5'-phosphate oxidase superfamily)
MRNKDKEITERDEMIEIIQSQKIVTIAMSKDNEPYLVTVNYAFDREQSCFYFHCGYAGKKIDFLESNPMVWGQVLDDRNYKQGECNHKYQTVQFLGEVSFMRDREEKLSALNMLIEQLEEDPESLKEKYINENSLDKVNMVSIKVNEMWGKRNI